MTRDIDLVVELSPGTPTVLPLFEGDFYSDRAAVRSAIPAGAHQPDPPDPRGEVTASSADSEYRRRSSRVSDAARSKATEVALSRPKIDHLELDWMRETRSEVQLADVRNS